MPTTTEVPDFIFTSKSQSAEQIQAALKERGFNEFETDGLTDAPPDEPAVETPPEPGAAAPPEPVVETPPEPARPLKESGSAKYKRQRDEARQRAADLERRLAEATGTAAPASRAATPAAAPVAAPAEIPEPTLPPKPKFEDFINSDDANSDFTEALTDWKLNVRDLKREHEEKKRQRAEDARKATERSAADAQTAALESWKQAGRERYEDFDEIALNPTITITPAMGTAVMDSERSHDLAHWLGSHPVEAKKIAAATKYAADASPDDVRRAVNKASRLLGAIEAGLPPAENDAPDADDEPAGDTPDDESAGAQPAAAAPPPAPPKSAQQPPVRAAAPVPPVKPIPPTPIGNRGGGSAGQKRISQMTPEELRRLHPDKYRELAAKGMY